MRRLIPLALGLAASLPQGAAAFSFPQDEAAAAFVANNVISTFYHELGHAFVDGLALPVLGREEDAADTLAAVLTHQFWLEDSAFAIIADTALAYELYALEAEAASLEPAYWDEHSLDMQRYYTLVCLFYGAEPDLREAAAIELGLPEDRAVRCPDEYAQAEESWAALLEPALVPETGPPPGAAALRLEPTAEADLAALLAEEIAAVNQSYALPETILVRVEPCGEANAFYHPDARTITMCTEYAEDLLRLWEDSGLSEAP